jgi:hypothetical protein
VVKRTFVMTGHFEADRAGINHFSIPHATIPSDKVVQSYDSLIMRRPKERVSFVDVWSGQCGELLLFGGCTFTIYISGGA